MLALVVAPLAHAQDDELASGARGGYAWGESDRAAEPDDPLRIMAFVGAGIGLRPLINLDPPFSQELLAPPFLDLGAAVFFPGSEVRHGAGLALTANLAADANGGVPPFAQWVLTPSYHLLLPLRRLVPSLEQDWLHVQGRVGLPIVIASALGQNGDGVDVSLGVELAGAVHFKFLAGLGVYLELTAAFFGGSESTVHPVLSADAGFLFDYEVLP